MYIFSFLFVCSFLCPTLIFFLFLSFVREKKKLVRQIACQNRFEIYSCSGHNTVRWLIFDIRAKCEGEVEFYAFESLCCSSFRTSLPLPTFISIKKYKERTCSESRLEGTTERGSHFAEGVSPLHTHTTITTLSG